ncbi:MAG: hypothetical protein KDD53_02565, partial [Bdellovibrionales bacterium]|nr:hypothetical protein [Bdellovibrionales bacterium]
RADFVKSHMESGQYLTSTENIAWNDAYTTDWVLFSFENEQSADSISYLHDRGQAWALPVDVEDLSPMLGYGPLATVNGEIEVLDAFGLYRDFKLVPDPWSIVHNSEGTGATAGLSNNPTVDRAAIKASMTGRIGEIVNGRRYAIMRASTRTRWSLAASSNPEVDSNPTVPDYSHDWLGNYLVTALLRPDSTLVKKAL